VILDRKAEILESPPFYSERGCRRMFGNADKYRAG